MVERIAVGLAVVERFQGGQFFLVLLDQVGEFVEQSAALGGAHLRPGAFLERFARRLDGQVDVGLVAFGNLANGFAGGRVDRGEGLARDAVEPFAADEQRLVLDLGGLTVFSLRWVAVAEVMFWLLGVVGELLVEILPRRWAASSRRKQAGERFRCFLEAAVLPLSRLRRSYESLYRTARSRLWSVMFP